MSLALVITLAACSEKAVPIAKTDPHAGSAAVTPPDDHPAPAHVDGVPVRPPPQPNGHAHPIEVTLRSSPPGATAAVDGTPIGTTPAYWAGDADGREHEFTFDLRGYELARYRFVPVTSGVIHARLDPLAEETDAGVSPETAVPGASAVLVNPPPAAVAVPTDAYVAPVPPPPTIVPATGSAPSGSAPPPSTGGLGPQP